MTATENGLEVPALMVDGEPIRPGQVLYRAILCDTPDSDSFEVSVAIADIADPLNVVMDKDGVEAVAFGSSLIRKEERHYRSDLKDKPLPNTAYDSFIRVPNLVKGLNDIDRVITELVDNANFAQSGHAWSASILGESILRPFMRSMHAATGDGEINTPYVDYTATDPQKRALAVNFLIGKTWWDYMRIAPSASTRA